MNNLSVINTRISVANALNQSEIPTEMKIYIIKEILSELGNIRDAEVRAEREQLAKEVAQNGTTESVHKD